MLKKKKVLMMCLLTFFFLLQENHQHIRMRGDSWPCKEFQGFHKAKKKRGVGGSTRKDVERVCNFLY